MAFLRVFVACVVGSLGPLLTDALAKIEQTISDLAEDEGSTTVGNLRIQVLSPRIVRVEHSLQQQWEDRGSLTFPQRGQSVRRSTGTFRVSTASSGVTTITTEALVVSAVLADLDGTPTCATLNVTVRSTGRTWCPEQGLTDAFNLNGSASTTDCYTTADACIQAYLERMRPGLLSRSGLAVVDDSATPLLDDSEWVVQRPALRVDNYVDWYMVESTEYARTLGEFAVASGPSPKLPYSAYNVWFSGYFPYASSDYRLIVSTFASRSLPLANLVLDMDWHETGDAVQGCGPSAPLALQQCSSGYGGYTWNATLFPDAEGFLTWAQGPPNNFAVMTNQHNQCGIDRCQRRYDEFARRLGVSPATGAPVMCAFSNRTYVEALYELMLEDPSSPTHLISYFWDDYGLNGEGAELGCSGQLHCMQCLGDIPLGIGNNMGDNVAALWTAHVRTTRLTRQKRRGMMLGVWGGLGHQRYPIVGSGDTHESWATLAWEVYATMTAANVLTPWTHDIGGFYGADAAAAPGWKHDPMLYLRWVQFGVFSPFFRPHASAGDVLPWLYPNVNELEPYWRLRSALQPYIYTAADIAWRTGIIISRPLYYEWPAGIEAVYNVSQFRGSGASLQYAFGDAFVVAAVTVPGTPAAVDVFVPPGRWLPVLEAAAQPGTAIVGPVWLPRRPYAAPEYPVLARAGAVVPMKRLEDARVASPAVVIVTVFWSAADSGTGLLVEDDGESLDYQSGVFSKVAFVHTAVPEAKTTKLDVTPSMAPKHKAPEVRMYDVRFRGASAAPRSVTVNGVEAGVDWRQTDGGLVGDDDAFAHAAHVVVPVLFVSSGWVAAADSVSIVVQW